jgi:hypothetical protein
VALGVRETITLPLPTFGGDSLKLFHYECSGATVFAPKVAGTILGDEMPVAFTEIGAQITRDPTLRGGRPTPNIGSRKAACASGEQ